MRFQQSDVSNGEDLRAAHSRGCALVVDDDQAFCALMARSLELFGFTAVSVFDGQAALDQVRRQPYDLVLLDMMMPRLDGLCTCRELRSFTDVPIIMVTAMNRSEDVVQSISAGADSVIVKPFRFREAEARIMAVMRRAAYSRRFVLRSSDADAAIKRTGNQVAIDGRLVSLSRTEYRLYALLAARTNQPVSKQTLLRMLWGESHGGDVNLVERLIVRLRVKIELNPARPERLITCAHGSYMLRSGPGARTATA